MARSAARQHDNGGVLFVFVNDRKMRIETGYGLEGALPDALAGRILDEQVRPRFRAGDWAGGLEAGIDGIIAATRGEYQAPPRQRRKGGSSGASIVVLVVFVLLFLWLASLGTRRTARTYAGRGWRRGGYWGGGGFGGCGRRLVLRGQDSAAGAAASRGAGAPSAAAAPRAAGEGER